MRHTALLLVPLLAGCVALAPVESASLQDALGILDERGAATPAAAWEGRLESSRGGSSSMCVLVVCTAEASPRDAGPCEPPACETRLLEVAVPPGHWEAHEGGLRVVLDFGEEWNVSALPRLLGPSGAVVAEGAAGWFAAVAFLPEPAAGTYTLEARATWGEGAYRAVALLESAPRGDPARELLPNLVTRPPRDLRVEAPGPDLLAPALGLAGIRGCGPDEIVEQGARRCLRFGNVVGNAGEGPLEVRMTAADAVAAFAGRGEWRQLVHAADGSVRDAPVGPATWHAVHGHYHYAGLAHYEVFRYDEETKTRGESLNTGRKAGFCFLDSGLLAFGAPGAAEPRFETCGDTMGVSAGWFDLYDWHLSEQYVDVSDAPDGTYELVTRVNAEEALLETSYDDNEASVVFRLRGDAVEIVR